MNLVRADAMRVLAALVLALASAGRIEAQGSGSSGATPAADTSWFAEYHPVARDTLPAATYAGWEQFQVNCTRCHGQDAEGTSVAPSLVDALGPDGPVKTEAAFLSVACHGVPGTAMPAWCTLGLGPDQLRQIYLYLSGRARGTIHPGRPMERTDTAKD